MAKMTVVKIDRVKIDRCRWNRSCRVNYPDFCPASLDCVTFPLVKYRLYKADRLTDKGVFPAPRTR